MICSDRKKEKFCALMQETAETDAVIAEAEAEYERTGKLYDAHEAMAFLREKYLSKPRKPL